LKKSSPANPIFGFSRMFYLRLMIILLPGLAAAGCGKNVAPAAPDPPAPVEFVAAPSAITPPEPRVAAEPAEEPRPEAAAPPGFFVEAERNFEAGNYRQAAQAFEKFLNAFPKAADRDRALFHYGFSLALSGNDKDLIQTEAAFRRLIAEFPKSPYRRQAEWILDLKTRAERLQADVKDRDERIRQLSDELRKLKSIDLDRRPSRPE
jgi:TolA-binding protein